MTKINEIIPGKLYQFKPNFDENRMPIWGEDFRTCLGFIRKGDIVMILMVKILKFDEHGLIKLLTTEGIVGYMCINIQYTPLTMAIQ